MVLPGHEHRASTANSVFTAQFTGGGVQAEQQMQFIIAQPFCFEGLGDLNVTVYKWELLGEIKQCKPQSDLKGIRAHCFL